MEKEQGAYKQWSGGVRIGAVGLFECCKGHSGVAWRKDLPMGTFESKMLPGPRVNLGILYNFEKGKCLITTGNS